MYFNELKDRSEIIICKVLEKQTQNNYIEDKYYKTTILEFYESIIFRNLFGQYFGDN